MSRLPESSAAIPLWSETVADQPASALDRLEDFDYVLPEELIAQAPVEPRSASRLLRVHGDGVLQDLTMSALPGLLCAGDLLVFNDTRVMKARLYGQKDSGGRVEMLIERLIDARHASAQVRASHAPRPGTGIHLRDGTVLTVLERNGEFFQLRAPEGRVFSDILEAQGRLPLPPYITRDPQAQDNARYQTIYAAQTGAVAAPTAGLHFDQALLDRLRLAGVSTAFLTLHVGAGTFQPVRARNLNEHRMHTEHYQVPASLVEQILRTRAAGRQVVAVGTTTLRALESAARSAQPQQERLSGGIRAGEGETALFIRPGFRFQVVDRLLTNFHLPKSTLMMLVSAFAGHRSIMRAYRHAVQERYRFFSYGDAMLLDCVAQGTRETPQEEGSQLS